MKKTFVLIAILLSSSTLFLCSKKDGEGQLVIYGVSPMDGVSTSDNANFFSTPVASLLFTSPGLFDIENREHNLLTEDARYIPDLKEWGITLKGGFRFHNGQPVTASDVVFSIKERMEAGSAKFKVIREVNAVNDRELKLRLAFPLFDISDLLDVSVYSKRIFKADEPWRETILKNPIGSGPFRFKRWLDNGVELVANDDYPEGGPKLGRVAVFYEKDEGRKLNLLLKGEADMLSPISPKCASFLEKDSRYYVNKAVIPYYAAIFLNNQSPVFKDEAVRKAINMAIKKDWLIEKGLDGAGVPASGPFITAMLPDGYSPSTYSYDPKEAEQLLKKAGWKDKRLSFKLYYMKELDEMKRLADMIAQQLYEIGVEAEGVPVNQDEFMNKQFMSGEYDAFLTTLNSFSEKGWQSRSIYKSTSLNFSDYSNKEVDRLFDQANNTPEGKEKKRIYGEIDRIIHEDAPAVFLYNPAWFSAINKRIKGAEDFMGDPYSWYKIKDWSVNERVD